MDVQTGFTFLNSKHECNVKTPLNKNRFTKCLMWFEMQWNSQIVWSSGVCSSIIVWEKEIGKTNWDRTGSTSEMFSWVGR